MKFVIDLISAFLLLGGIAFLLFAFTTPFGYNLALASAPQVTQVYIQAAFYALMAIGLFLMGMYLQSAKRE